MIQHLMLQDSSFIAATGGTITTCGDYKIHTFTGPGTFTCSVQVILQDQSVDYLVVAGGGGGGGQKLVVVVELEDLENLSLQVLIQLIL